MLNINFVEQKKKAVKLELDYFYWAATAIVMLIFILIFNGALSSSIKSYEKEITDKKAEVKKNEQLLAQIKSLQSKRLDLQKKKEIIDRLDLDRQKWVRVLDTMTDIIPNQVWLTSFDGKGNLVEISGVGMTFLYINEFIKILQEQDFVSAIALKSIVAGTVPEFSQPIQRFAITITLK